MALLFCVCIAVSLPLYAQETTIARISPTGASATEPRIASAPNGDCAVVWRQAAPYGSGSSVAIRQRHGGVWENVHLMGSGPSESSVDEPCVRLDSAGHPHVVWVASDGNQNHLEYAFFTESVWVHYGTIAPPTTHKIEHPVLMMGPRKQVFLVWQESVGLVYQIHAFVIDAKGAVTHRILAGENPMRYVIYPDLVELPSLWAGSEPRIAAVWFSLDKPQGELTMRVWNSARSDWQPLEAPDWTTRSLQSLPLVTGSSMGGPILIGYRPEGRYDRIFMSSEEYPLAFLDRNTPVQNRLPRIGQPLGDRFGLVWQQETDEGVNLVQAALRASGEIYSAPLARVDPLLPPQPDVALSTGTLMTVWTTLIREAAVPVISNASLQVPAIHFSEMKIPGSSWRSLAAIPAGE